MGRIFIAIIMVFLLLGAFFTPINEGIKGWRTSDTTEAFVVTTGGGETAANVTLGHDLFQAETSEVIGISSNITESPIASSYNENTLALEVSALSASQVRTLTIEYYADSDSTLMQIIGPFLSFLIFGGILAAIAIGAFGKFH